MVAISGLGQMGVVLSTYRFKDIVCSGGNSAGQFVGRSLSEALLFLSRFRDRGT